MGVSENIINLLQTMDANDKNIGEIEKQIEYMKKEERSKQNFRFIQSERKGERTVLYLCQPKANYSSS